MNHSASMDKTSANKAASGEEVTEAAAPISPSSLVQCAGVAALI